MEMCTLSKTLYDLKVAHKKMTVYQQNGSTAVSILPKGCPSKNVFCTNKTIAFELLSNRSFTFLHLQPLIMGYTCRCKHQNLEDYLLKFLDITETNFQKTQFCYCDRQAPQKTEKPYYASNLELSYSSILIPMQ
jgi:hypothetical protein